MQANSMENNSDHFLGGSLEFHNYDEKVDSNDTLVSHTEDFPETKHQKARDQTLAECPTCFAKFTQKNNLRRHILRFHGANPTTSHMKTNISFALSECTECNVKFTRRSNLLRHLKKFHDFLAPTKNPELPKIFSCTECDGKFTKWRNCVRHMRNFHSVGNSNEVEVKDEPSLEPECNSLKEEENTDNMEYVIEVDPFPVISPLRGETISSEPADSSESVTRSENQLSESSSNQKRESSTKKASKLICEECGVSFSTPFNLKRHKKRLHVGRDDDMFSVVQAIIETTDVKKSPLADTPDNKLFSRTCQQCHILFSSPFNQRRHMKRIHAEKEIDLAASPQPKADSTNRKKSANGSRENRLFCPMCTESDVSFSTPFNLKRHQKRVHPDKELDSSAASQSVTETSAADSPENLLFCPLGTDCNVSFSTPSTLRRHMRRFHQQTESSITAIQEPIVDTVEIKKCPLCDYRENRLNLYVHFNLVHGLQVIIEYQLFDSEAQLDEWLSQIDIEAQFVVRKSDSDRTIISCSQPNGSENFCPAEMIILNESGKCTVHYVKTHVHES